MRRGGEGGTGGDSRDRGVSETISFVLVFALVVASVGTVYALGVGELESARDAERVENAQRAFDVLAENLGDLLEGAPSRGTEVKIADATLRSTGGVAVNVTVDPASGPAESWSYSTAAIVYDVEAGGAIRLSNGAVLRDSERGTATVVRGPPLVVEDGRVLLRLIKQEHVGSAAVGGSDTVRIRMLADRPRVFYDDESADFAMVRVNVTTPYTDAWARYYDSLGFNCTEVAAPTPDASGRISCTVSDVEDLERVTVVWMRVTTSFE